MNTSSDSVLDRVAQQLIRWRLTVPAIVFLQAHKPLSFVGAQLLLVLEPVLVVFLPHRWIVDGVTLLTDSRGWDVLLHKLETLQRKQLEPAKTSAISSGET